MGKGAPLVTDCIFSEPTKPHKPLTQEHIWGKWIKAFVRGDMNKHRLKSQEIGLLGSPDKTKITLRAGDPTQSSLKIVCGDCNNGWMSEIQKRAKPFLVPLIQGRHTILGEKAQSAIAAWCTMVTMTGDYLSRDTTAVSITQAERDWFRDNLTPPENWKIWIGHYAGTKGRWTHFVVPILNAEDVPKAGNNPVAPPNSQATTFVIGNLCVHVMSSTGDPAIVARWTWPFNSRIRLNLPQIWPPREGIIAWPPQSLTDFEVELVSTAFERVIDAASRSLFGRRLV